MLVVDQEYVERLKKEQKRLPRISSLYGMDSIFKEIYKIPTHIPIAQVCLLEHGANFQFSFFYERLLKSQNELIFFDNSHRVKEYNKQTGKKSYPIGPLYPKYRKKKGYEPKNNRYGTLAFPSHSSSQFDFSTGYKRYADDLKLLPVEFHPITICIYYYDILQGHHKLFIDEGFNVITNGYIADPNFIDNLYEHLSSFKYITSNHPGSYAFYALEMGIPFFLYGEGIDNQLLSIGKMNGVNMSDFIQNDFFIGISELMIIAVTKQITITEKLQLAINTIMDEHSILTPNQVRALVMKNWVPLLLKKGISFLKQKLRRN